MSLFSPKPPTAEATQGQKGEVVIVASEYNEHLVGGMIEHAKKEFVALASEIQLSLVRVPGAFEIPLAVQQAAKEKEVVALLALGVLLQGETSHADLIAEAVTKSLLEISLRYEKPVIHAVLLLDNEGQALSRCLNDSNNRGTEAARAALKSLGSLGEATL